MRIEDKLPDVILSSKTVDLSLLLVEMLMPYHEALLDGNGSISVHFFSI